MADPFRIISNNSQSENLTSYYQQYPGIIPFYTSKSLSQAQDLIDCTISIDDQRQSYDSSLSAFLSGSSAANIYKGSYQWNALIKSELAYREAFIDLIKNNSPIPNGAILHDAALRGLKAMNALLSKYGIDINDTYGSHISKASNFLLNKSKSSEPIKYINPELIIQKALHNDTPGDYVVHVMKRDYLNNPQDSKLANSNLAWFTPIEDIAGLKLDKESILRSVGFDEKTVRNNLPDSYLLAIYRSQDLGLIEKPTWDLLINKAKKDQGFDDLKTLYGDSLFDELPAVDYKGYKLIEDKNLFLSKLSAREKALYQARELIEKNYGANHLFSGKGYTIDPYNTYAVREFVIANERVAATPPHALLELKRDGSAAIISNSLEGPPNRLIFSKDNAKGGAFSALAAIATGLYDDYSDFKTGKITANDWLRKIPSNIAVDGSFGFGSGFIENIVEKSTTQAIVQKFGTSSTILGQTLRQLPGAFGAGAIISFGASSYDQINRYRDNQIKFSAAAGNITSETAIGGTSSLLGAGIGSWATTKIIGHGAGLLAGGLTGIGLGVAAGYGLDSFIRSQGWDKAISSWSSRQIDKISYFASDTWDKAKIVGGYTWYNTKYYSGVAWQATKSIASDTWNGVRYGATSAWNFTSGAINGAWNFTKSIFE